MSNTLPVTTARLTARMVRENGEETDIQSFFLVRELAEIYTAETFLGDGGTMD
jgi:hypothetical protein